LGTALPPEVEALMAITRNDSAAAWELVNQVGDRLRLVKDDRLLYMVFTRPMAAQVHYALGDYAGTLRVAEGFEPGEFEVRQFDMRWGMLPRLRLLRGLAYERLGDAGAAAAEYEGTLRQWNRADPLLYPVLSQAERGLVRLGKRFDGFESPHQLTASQYHAEDGCPPPPSPGERK
jgi:hypothetical protein